MADAGCKSAFAGKTTDAVSVGDLPDEVLVAVIGAAVADDFCGDVSSQLRLVDRRWCALVDEVRGPRVDPWILGRCLQFLVGTGKAPRDADARRQMYPTPTQIVRAAIGAGCTIDLESGPLGQTNSADTMRAVTEGTVDWPYDLFTCICEMVNRHGEKEDGAAPWDTVSAHEKCPSCLRNPTRCVCLCRKHTREPRDRCQLCSDNVGTDAGLPNAPRFRGDCAYLDDDGDGAPSMRFAFDDESWSCVWDPERARWFWLAYVARCYQFLSTHEGWRNAGIVRLPCAAVVRNAHRVYHADLFDEGPSWPVTHGPLACAWSWGSRMCDCDRHQYIYVVDVNVEEDSFFTLDDTMPKGGPEYYY